MHRIRVNRKLQRRTSKRVYRLAVAHDTAQITDTLDKVIDPGILHLVTELRIARLKTTASCEGHLGRGEPAPWIDVGEYTVARLGHKSTTSAMLARNLIQQHKLLQLLDSYYRHRTVPADQRLILIPFGASGSFRMTPQGAPLQVSLPRAAQRRNLSRYLNEMERFAEFLKESETSFGDAHGLRESG